MSAPLCGLWIDREGITHLAHAASEAGPRAVSTAQLRPFAWTDAAPPEPLPPGLSVTPLAGEGPFNHLLHADSLAVFDPFVRTCRESAALDVVKPLESQFLLQNKQRLFDGLPFSRLRRAQLDIETASAPGQFSDASLPDDRVLAIGLRFGDRDRTLVLDAFTDAAERTLLQDLNRILAEEDPDTLEGHNLYKFDLDYLRRRAKRLKVPCLWGRFGQPASFRSSRLKIAERWLDFPRCDLPGRTVVDTYLLVQLHDISARELTSYGLKDVAVHFGITREEDDRTYLPGSAIFQTYRDDRASFLAYLADDLRETKGVADLLLPTYYEQVKTFPILLQEAILRGSTGKIDLLFLESYYHARRTCPTPPPVSPFEGGYTRSFREGVYQQVLHFDVASLYPSLLLAIDRNPRNDSLGVFIPLLRQLRTYRLHYKQLARSSPDPEERAEAAARQASFKILINSFYGYLGFSGARFGDAELAAEVTRRGREILQSLIDAFNAAGCTVLEADTDGIYLASPEFFDTPDPLLARVAPILPPGIELEYDGRYDAMFCYKAKNYALREGDRVILRGSALRSRGIEPFLKKLSDHLIRHLLGLEPTSPLERLANYRRQITAHQLDVTELAKSEILGTSPEAYERLIASGGKPRRASAEVALQLDPRPRLGERIRYYLATHPKARAPDWQRARPLSLHDPVTAPYDPACYLAKLDDWLERYATFLNVPPPGGLQGELL